MNEKIHPYVFAGLRQMVTTQGNEPLSYGVTEQESNTVLETVCEILKVTPEQVRGKERFRTIVLARHITCHIFRNKFQMQFKRIGLFLGGRDHSTIVHAINSIKDWMDTDSDIMTLVTVCEHAVKQKLFPDGATVN